MTHPTDDEIIKRCKAAGIRWLPPAPDAGEGDFPGAFDLVTMVEMRALLATQGEPVAWALGNPRYVHATNIFPAHEFTPDAERADEWTALYDHPAPSALLAEQARTEPTKLESNIHESSETYLHADVEAACWGEYTVEASRDNKGADWYIVVTAPNGMRDYDGYWRNSAHKTVDDVINEAICGACLTAVPQPQPLKAEQAKDAAEDAELLDWLEEAYTRGGYDQGREWREFMNDVAQQGFRAAIRAARAAERKA